MRAIWCGICKAHYTEGAHHDHAAAWEGILKRVEALVGQSSQSMWTHSQPGMETTIRDIVRGELARFVRIAREQVYGQPVEAPQLTQGRTE